MASRITTQYSRGARHRQRLVERYLSRPAAFGLALPQSLLPARQNKPGETSSRSDSAIAGRRIRFPDVVLRDV
jgi:hypothetical protein